MKTKAAMPLKTGKPLLIPVVHRFALDDSNRGLGPMHGGEPIRSAMAC